MSDPGTSPEASPRHTHAMSWTGMGGWVGLGLLVVLAIGLAIQGVRERKAFLAEIQRSFVEAELQRAVARLELFLFELDGRVLQAEPVAAEGSGDGGSWPTIKAAIQATLAHETAPELASASVYQDIDADEVEQPFVLLATASADGAPALEPIPEAVLWDELEHADSQGGTTSLVWFSPDAGSGVRLNLVGTAMHEDTATSTARLRLIHVSAPFRAWKNTAFEARCDIAGGKRDPDLPPRRADGGPSQRNYSIAVMRPEDLPRLRWPQPDDDRARGFAQGQAEGGAWFIIVGVVIAASMVGRVLVSGRRRRELDLYTDAPSAPSPDAPSPPEPEGP